MKNKFLGFFFLFIGGISVAFAQKPEYVHLSAEKTKIEKSVFSQIEVVDTRFDKEYMGFVQKGLMNRRAPVKLKRPLSEEVKEFALQLIDSADKEDGTLLINIRNFFMSELTGAFSESGTFVLKASFYYKRNDKYDLMFSVDTSIVVKSMDVTHKLLRTVNLQWGRYIEKAATFDLAQIGTEGAWTYDDIQDVDLLEKKQLPVFNTDLPERGLYLTYEDFKDNRPTETNFIKEIHNKTKAQLFFYTKKDGTKGKPVMKRDYYAICDGEGLYISTQYGFYPARKQGYDFFFTGMVAEAANASNVAMASLFFGVIGAAVASIPSKGMYEFKIDHTNGKFLPIRKLD